MTTKQASVLHTSFRPGDPVRNASEESECYGKEGTFLRYWRDMPGGHLYTTNNACDVCYPGMIGPDGYLGIAQSADDLVKVVNDGTSDIS
jgi:hypothetical protein